MDSFRWQFRRNHTARRSVRQFTQARTLAVRNWTGWTEGLGNKSGIQIPPTTLFGSFAVCAPSFASAGGRLAAHSFTSNSKPPFVHGQERPDSSWTATSERQASTPRRFRFAPGAATNISRDLKGCQVPSQQCPFITPYWALLCPHIHPFHINWPCDGNGLSRVRGIKARVSFCVGCL